MGIWLHQVGLSVIASSSVLYPKFTHTSGVTSSLLTDGPRPPAQPANKRLFLIKG